MEHFTATYSPEDNKLRIYSISRLDDELYQRFKANGFRWAPKQELFVAPSWSPGREDFCIEIAGKIEPEQTTMVDRATVKAERLDNLATKRLADSNAFAEAADRIAERFSGGQPILIGHHSEKKARKDQKQMDRNMEKARQSREAVNYWQYKAEGVERHANRKADSGVRQRRIKKLLAELRDRQRTINHANVCIKLWNRVIDEKRPEEFNRLVKHYVGGQIATGSTAPFDLWSKLDQEKITPKEAANEALTNAENIAKHPYYHRWISHILNRLGFERSELGDVARFEGEITPTILKEFARNQGALKPVVERIEDLKFKLSTPVPLPSHIQSRKHSCIYGNTLQLTDDGFIELMHSVGYEVPNKKPAQSPILNFKCEHLTKAGGRYSWDKEQTYPQIEMTKEEHKASYNTWVMLSSCGTFRFRGGFIGRATEAKRVAIFLTDSKKHEAPESKSINNIFSEV